MSAWEMRGEPVNVLRWTHQWGTHNRSVVWDTLPKWVGEGKDWVQEMERNPPQEGPDDC